MSDTDEHAYPRMLYHESGRTMRAENEEAERDAGEGWQREPMPVHRVAPRNIGTATGDEAIPVMLRDIRTLLAGGAIPLAPGALPAPGGGGGLAGMIRDTMERVLDERGIGRREPEAAEERPLLQPKRRSQEQ